MAERLQQRSAEIEAAVVTRVLAISGPVTNDPEYILGLKTACRAAIAHGIAALECSQEHPPPIPTALLAQARLAARMEVPLDTVLRRYFAGYTLLLDFVVEEARESPGLAPSALQEVLRGQGVIHERVVEQVSEEYAREPGPASSSGAEQRSRVVRRLLDGESFGPYWLDYDFEVLHHVGLIARGRRADVLIKALADLRGTRRLIVGGSDGSVWGWLGSRLPLDTVELAAAAEELAAEDTTLAIAEPAPGLPGWRLTHRQARAAMAVASRRKDRLVRYLDVALIASLLHDEVLEESLRALYLRPLAEDRDGGESVRRTLRAYFSADRNVSSAAAALGVNRQTVTKRLRAVEDRLGGALTYRAADLEAALHLDELSH